MLGASQAPPAVFTELPRAHQVYRPAMWGAGGVTAVCGSLAATPQAVAGLWALEGADEGGVAGRAGLSGGLVHVSPSGGLVHVSPSGGLVHVEADVGGSGTGGHSGGVGATMKEGRVDISVASPGY